MDDLDLLYGEDMEELENEYLLLLQERTLEYMDLLGVECEVL